MGSITSPPRHKHHWGPGLALIQNVTAVQSATWMWMSLLPRPRDQTQTDSMSCRHTDSQGWNSSLPLRLTAIPIIPKDCFYFCDKKKENRVGLLLTRLMLYFTCPNLYTSRSNTEVQQHGPLLSDILLVCFALTDLKQFWLLAVMGSPSGDIKRTSSKTKGVSGLCHFCGPLARHLGCFHDPVAPNGFPPW